MITRSTRNDQDFALFGLSLAYLGRYDEAIAAGQQALVSRDPRAVRAPGYNEFNLARVYAMAGRRDSAIATLERVLKIPLYVTPGWLRIDPTFASLRSDPRFRRLAEME
jgi:tetratricopeptide (TPR) repeat protein